MPEYRLQQLFYSFFFSSRRRHTRCGRDWSSDVCSSDLLSPSRQRWPVGLDGKPETSTSYRITLLLVERRFGFPSKKVFWKYQPGPQLSTSPTFKSSPRMWRIMSCG